MTRKPVLIPLINGVTMHLCFFFILSNSSRVVGKGGSGGVSILYN